MKRVCDLANREAGIRSVIPYLVHRLAHNDTVTAQGEITDRIEQILKSVPIDSIRDEVYIALQTRPEEKVTLNYTPSSIEAIFVSPDGRVVTQNGSWGIQKVDA